MPIWLCAWHWLQVKSLETGRDQRCIGRRRKPAPKPKPPYHLGAAAGKGPAHSGDDFWRLEPVGIRTLSRTLQTAIRSHSGNNTGSTRSTALAVELQPRVVHHASNDLLASSPRPWRSCCSGFKPDRKARNHSRGLVGEGRCA